MNSAATSELHATSSRAWRGHAAAAGAVVAAVFAIATAFTWRYQNTAVAVLVAVPGAAGFVGTGLVGTARWARTRSARSTAVWMVATGVLCAAAVYAGLGAALLILFMTDSGR